MFPGNELKRYPQFSKREQEVLNLVIKGWSNREIAKILCLTQAYIERLLSEIYFKLELADIDMSVKNRRILATRYVFLTEICETCFKNLLR